MSHIRVTYSGLVSFGTVLLTVFTGLAFTLIVTRNLSQEEFGTWSLIGSLIVLVMVFDPISTYWVTRHVARNEKASITALGSNMLFSVAAIILYFGIILVMTYTTDADFHVLLYSMIMVPLLYMGKEMKGILSGFRPQAVSYGLLVFEVIKIPIGFVTIYWLDLGIQGAITTTILSQSCMIGYYTISIREKLKEKFQWDLFKKWLKLSWLPLFNGNTDRLVNLDATIYSTIVGSVSGLAYIGASKALANIISMTTYLSSGLYPKLIASKKGEYIEMVFKRTLLFTIPILGLALVFAKPGLWIINPIYVDGVLIVYAWAFTHFTYVFHALFSSSLLGLENVDEKTNPKFKEFLKSKLFTVPAVDLIGRAVGLVFLTVVILIIFKMNFQDLAIIFWWGVIIVITNIVIVSIYWKMISKTIPFKFPIINTLKYVTATITSSIFSIFLLENYLIYDESIFIFGPRIIPYLLLFASIYVSIMYIWDRESREFIKSIFNEIKK